MKVLGIVCSPRKGGNTEILMEEALAAAREAGAETEIFLVAGKNINGCDACRSCAETFICRIRDDMQPLYHQMETADAIIFGSPVYFHNVTSQAKAIIDRTYLFLQDRKLKGKVATSVLALRRVGAGMTQDQLYGFFLSQGMIPVRGAIGYGRAKGDVRTGDGGGIGITALEEAHSVGTEIIERLKQLGLT